MGGEMAQKGGFFGDFETANGISPIPDGFDDFDAVIDVALSVNAPGQGQADELHFGRY
jgi:hypothetical protein